MFREAVQIIHRMWTEDKPTFSGEHYSIDGPINEPKNASGTPDGKVPLWIGGGGEQVTLKLVAQYGDACNVGGGNAETIKHKLDVLQDHCQKVGRDYAQITKSSSFEGAYPIPNGADPAQATAKVREFYGGVDYETFAKGKLIGTADQIGERIQAAVDAGMDYAITYIPGVAYDHDPLHRFAEEVIPKFS